MSINWPLTLGLALGLVILVWFAVGTQWNVSKGRRVLRWLQGGLPLLGERTTLRWYGSSAIHMQIAKARDPFREAEVLIILEPRDVSLLWLLARLRGRRDLMIVRGRLRRPPRFEMELADPRSWTGREALGQMRHSAWSELKLPLTPLIPLSPTGLKPGTGGRGGQKGEGLTLLYQVGEASERAPEFLTRLLQVSPSVARLSFRRGDITQFQVHIGLPDIQQANAHQLFRTFVQIVRDVMEA
ncbi:MAG: hypothetical protein C4311_04215 [Chloroflexota bacterium]